MDNLNLVVWVWVCLCVCVFAWRGDFCNFVVGTDCSEGFPILFMIRDAGSSDSICGDSGSF